jgi:hypothetical protein
MFEPLFIADLMPAIAATAAAARSTPRPSTAGPLVRRSTSIKVNDKREEKSHVSFDRCS